MELNGALLNRGRLADADLLVGRLAESPAPQTQSQSHIPPRAGAVQAAVIRALAEADQPLRAREIHQAAEKLAGTELSWNTVKDCLHKHARRPDSPIERVSHGRYRVRQETTSTPEGADGRRGGARARW
jgi:hypothetical protein